MLDLNQFYQQQQQQNPGYVNPGSSPGQGWMTPNQIKAQRDYANNLMTGAIPSGTSGNVTAVSPWGGAAHLAGSLIGGNLMSRSGQQERGSLLSGAQASSPNFTGMQPTPYLNQGNAPGMQTVNPISALFSKIPSFMGN